MNSEETLHKNLSLWSHLHPKEAIWLQYIDSSHLKFSKTEKKELNLKVGKSYFHDQKGALKEASKWFSSLSLSDIDVLYIYGLGLGYYYDAAKKWLKKSPDRHLVFLEDDLTALSKFFETKKAGSILKDSQVLIYYLSDIEESDIFNKLFWNFPVAKFDCFALNHYEKTKGSKYLKLRHQLFHSIETKRAALLEYLNFGKDFFKNYYLNLFKLPSAYKGHSFFGKFKNVPAIICGAGPSLKKSIPLIKKLKDRAIIFAGSSSLTALDFDSIVPHFGVGIDPFPGQIERLGKIKNLDFPFFYRGRFNSSALEKIKGPKLFLSGSGGYDISKWFEKKFNIEGIDFEEGRNVITFALEIASLMGCNPIIFVGMDLAFTDMLQYSDGVISDNSFVKDSVKEKVLIRKDIYGKDQQTLWKWVAESEWISDFATNNKNRVLINATEGGIGFSGVVNRPLKKVAEKYLTKRFNIERRIDNIVKKSKIRLTKKRVITANDALKASLKNCIKYLDIIIKEKKKMKRRVDNIEHLQSAESIVAECKLEEEIGYAYVLQIFNYVAEYYVEREFVKISRLSTKRQVDKKKDILLLNEMKLKFLKKVAIENIKLIDQATKNLG